MNGNKILVFDMDGTIANLYSVENWLPMLRNEDTTPYSIAEPMWDMEILTKLLIGLKNFGWTVAVTSWGSMGGSTEYCKRTKVAKKEWLDKYGFPYDILHVVAYGTTKADCTRKLGGYQILIDDSDKVRKGWTLGKTINPTECNLLKELAEMINAEMELM